MNFLESQQRVVGAAIEIVLSRKREVKPSKVSCLIELLEMQHSNPKITGYVRSMIINAITKSLAARWFMSRAAFDENAVEDFATFIEDNTVELATWYAV